VETADSDEFPGGMGRRDPDVLLQREDIAMSRAAASLITAGLAAALLLAGADGADAKKKKKAADADAVIDISTVKADMVIVSDGEGRFLAVAPDASSSGDFLFFSSDGKTFYQQRVRGGGSDGGTGAWSRTFWSPRVLQANLERKPFKKGETPGWSLACQTSWQDYVGDDFTQLPADDAKKIIEKASFKGPLWKRQAHFLARDDAGNYYYVDRIRDELGGKGYRLFKGPKGAMKEMAMTNIVNDSVGDIYTTKKGELRFVVTGSAAKWVAGSKSMELTNVPVEDNVVMIYGELGVYLDTLGTPCDEE
jgi:hypothetical protein